MAFTVVPLHNLDIGAGARIPFGPKFVLQDVPSWLTTDERTIAELSLEDRELVIGSKHALVSQYEALTPEYPDPDWTGTKPRDIQSTRFESAVLANFCIWLIQPSAVCFTNAFHALDSDGRRIISPPIVVPVRSQSRVYCHANDERNEVTGKHLIKAAELFAALATVPRNNSLWESLRAGWSGITTYDPDRRYPPLWMCLESLFGRDKPDDGLTRTLARRIAFFLADNHADAQELHDKVWRCYEMRCKIIHGRWDNDPALEIVLYETEGIVRTVFRVIAKDPKLLERFASPSRDKFLSELVHQRAKRKPALVEPTRKVAP